MRLNTVGTSINTSESLYVSGTTILNNTTTCTSSLNVSGITTLSSGTITGTLSFGSQIANYIINLRGTNNYGFGINSGMLRYNSDGNHTFFCAGTQRG